jgi:hypothetical protein
MTRPSRVLPALCCALALASPQGAGAQVMASGTVAELRGLDRVSGVTTDLAVAVGGRASYGRLDISLLGCRYPADNPNADAFAFLEIRDTVRSERLFLGWMIASAPALNALDHARYDVWVMGCRQGTVGPAAQPSGSGSTADAPAPDPASTDTETPAEPAADGEAPAAGVPEPVVTSIVPPRRPVR